MTSMYEAQKAVIAEVKDRILSLAPEYEENIRFSIRDSKMRALAEMDEDTGRTRLFEIGPAEYTGVPTYVGCSTRGLKYTHKIEILYPDDEVWNMGLNSDAELIRYDLINNATTSNGIQQRHLDPAAEMLVERNPDDPWVKLVLDLVVYYEIN